MSKNSYGFVFPQSIDVSGDAYQGTVTVSPLMRGFGHTLGNALRRILLSSMKGSAVVEIWIDGVVHEYDVIPNVREDVMDILMNMRLIPCTLDDSVEESFIEATASGVGSLKAGDFKGSHVVINQPDIVVAELTSPDAHIHIRARVIHGYGLMDVNRLNERHVFSSDQSIQSIKLDGLFGPVQKVSYHVDSVRVDRSIDYDRLSISIKTNGALTIYDAFQKAVGILSDHTNCLMHLQGQVDSVLNKNEDEKNKHHTSATLESLGFSPRLLGSLKSEGILNIADLLEKTELDLMKTPNIGKKSLTHIQEILGTAGLALRKE